MKNNAVFSAALSALILLSSSALTEYEAHAASSISVSDTTSDAASAPSAIGSAEKLGLSYRGEALEVKNDVKKRFIAAYNKIIAAEPLNPVTDRFSRGIYGFVAEYGGTQHAVTKIAGEYGYYLMIDDCYYPVDKTMDKIAAEILPDESSPADRLLECSVKCSEPKTNEDYIKAAQKCVYQWLDTLSGESGAYKVGSYSPYDGGRSDKFIAAGLVGGAKEFAVEVRFDVSGAARGSVFKAPSNSGYNDFYHYYDGSCAFVRCRWENGVCRIVGYDGAYMSSIGDGLYGINTSKSGYATFFDFFNDTKAVKSYKSKAVAPTNGGRSVVVSHNPFMISDGKIFYADIDLSSSRDLTSNKDGKVTGKFGDNFYAEDGTAVYSSPVDYNQAAYEPFELTFTDGFSFVFDDYNRDGNPDFTIKIGEDEQGSRYRVECIANDGSPRAGTIGTEVYVAGRSEDSIRLQNTENGYVTWSADQSGKLTPSQKLDDYRMYSQRYYLPVQFRGYTDEKKVICYFWNNTSKKVSAGGEYRIERNEDGKWVDTGVKGTVKSKTALPYRDTEFSFDISKLTKRPSGEYRIAMKCGKSTVYGGFYISSSAAAECKIAAESKTLPADRTSVSFSVTNTCGNPVRITSAQLLKSGKKVTDIDVSKLAVIAAGDSVKITAFAKDGELLGAGKYTLKINCGKYKFSGGATTLKKFPAERLTYFNGTATAVKTDAGLNVTLKNNIWSKESVRIADRSALYVLKEGEWFPTGYTLAGTANGAITADFGKSVTLKFENYMKQYLQDEEAVKIIKEYFEMMKSELDRALKNGDITKEEYARYKSMTYEDFIDELFGVTEISSGDQCKLALYGDMTENVCFTVK